MSLERQIEDLHRAYREWAGEPFSISTFRRENLPSAAIGALDVLCYQSTDEDRLRPADEFTFFATAGLSLHHMDSPSSRIELLWRLTGRRSWEEIQVLAQALASVAVLPWYEPVAFAPDTVIRNVSLPVFDRTDSLLVTHWGVHDPEYLPGVLPPVALLCLKPLFGSEAAIVQRIGAREACRRFLDEGINWDDPARACATLQE